MRWSLPAAALVLAACATPPTPLHAPSRAVAWAWPGSHFVVADATNGTPLARISPFDAEPDAAMVDDGVLYTVSGGEVWTARLDGGATVFHHDSDGDHDPVLALDDQQLYVVRRPEGDQRQRRLVALDRQDGSERWAAALDGEGEAKPPCLAGGMVLAATDRTVTAVDRGAGKARWLFQSPAPIVATAAAGTQAYVLDAQGKLHALSIASGVVAWRQHIGRAEEDTAVLAATASRIVLVRGGHLVALEPNAGATLWRGPRITMATLGRDSAFAELGDGQHAAIDLTTGQPRWTRELGSPLQVALAEGDHLVLVRRSDEELRAYDLTRGSLRWRLPL